MMYSNNIVNFQESMTILNACTKKSGNLLNAPFFELSHIEQAITFIDLLKLAFIGLQDKHNYCAMKRSILGVCLH